MWLPLPSSLALPNAPVLLVLLAVGGCAQKPLAASPAQAGAVSSAPSAPVGSASAAPERSPHEEWKAQRNYPPLVFTSAALLRCSISSTQAGEQSMTTTSGQGFTFVAKMKPIQKSQLAVEGKGMRYKFDAFPSEPFAASFAGLGEGKVVEMKAEVEVGVKAFAQPGGPGTQITFDAKDIAADAAYVEFTGLWVRTRDSKRFPFRVLFGSVHSGGGKVLPASPEPLTSLTSKAVYLGSRDQPVTVTTSLFEEESDMPGPAGPARD